MVCAQTESLLCVEYEASTLRYKAPNCNDSKRHIH